MVTRRSILVIIVLLVAAALPAFASMTAHPSLPATISATPAAPHGTVSTTSGSLWRLDFNLLHVPTAPAHHASPPASVPVRASGNGPGESAAGAKRHAKPVTITGNPHTARIAWHEECSRRFWFCAKFPYVAGSKGVFETHDDYTSATSMTGYLFNFTGNVWVADSGRGYCPREFTAHCNPDGNFNAFYFVEVIPESRYAADPWQALTAINGGVQNPVWFYYRGNLACYFSKGIYGGPGIVVWHARRVYYLESGDLMQAPTNPLVLATFLWSLRF